MFWVPKHFITNNIFDTFSYIFLEFFCLFKQLLDIHTIRIYHRGLKYTDRGPLIDLMRPPITTFRCLSNYNYNYCKCVYFLFLWWWWWWCGPWTSVLNFKRPARRCEFETPDRHPPQPSLSNCGKLTSHQHALRGTYEGISRDVQSHSKADYSGSVSEETIDSHSYLNSCGGLSWRGSNENIKRRHMNLLIGDKGYTYFKKTCFPLLSQHL